MPKLELDRRITAGLTILSLVLSVALSTPGRALADDRDHGAHGEKHGPMPIAILGGLFGGVFWLASTPFCLLIAPTHIADSFDAMVAAPFRAAIGDEG